MDIENIKKITNVIREDIVTMIHLAGSGHPGGSLSAVEILTALYWGGIFQVDPNRPDDLRRDRFILSKGHCAPVLYSVLSRYGFFNSSHLTQLRHLGSILQGHPHASLVPGLDCSSGSLGQGLSIANGIAMGFKVQGITNRVYCLLGDGELQEGQIWEAAMTASQYRLNNLCAIVDNNHVQLDGRTEEIKQVEPVIDKWRAFGWHVIPLDGHNLADLLAGYRCAMMETQRPSVIVAETVKGKGVSFMENKSDWHGNAPNSEQLTLALAEIRAH